MKMRVAITAYYEVDMTDPHGAYKTTVPEEMAIIDLEQLRRDPALFLDLVDMEHFEITPLYDSYREDPRWITAHQEYRASRTGDFSDLAKGIEAAVKMRDIEIEYQEAT